MGQPPAYGVFIDDNWGLGASVCLCNLLCKGAVCEKQQRCQGKDCKTVDQMLHVECLPLFMADMLAGANMSVAIYTQINT